MALSLVCPTVAGAGERDLTIAAAGDLAWPGGQHDAALEAEGAGLFRLVEAWLSQADLRFVNLENPFTSAAPAADKPYVLVAPPHRLDWVLDGGFNLLSLANNHALDAGPTGLSETLALLGAARGEGHVVWWAGADPEPARSFEPTIFSPRGKSLVIAFCAFGNGRAPEVASWTSKAARRAVREAARLADLVIVSVHGGREYRHVPEEGTIHRLRSFVRAGADLVLAHHAHVARGVERYQQGLVFYGLGNFSFASITERHHKVGAELLGMVPLVEVREGAIAGARILPIYVDNGFPWALEGEPPVEPLPFVPQPLEGAYAEAALARFDRWSRAIPGNRTRVVPDAGSAVGIVRY